PLDACAELPFSPSLAGPFERPALVIAAGRAELARQRAVGHHALGVEPVISLRLLAHRVHPGERGAAGSAAGHAGLDRDDPSPHAGERVHRAGAHDAHADDGDVVPLHPLTSDIARLSTRAIVAYRTAGGL